MDVRHGAQSSGAYYQLGRYHAGSQAWGLAIDAYRRAIAADARNVEAYNALGVALAGDHRYEEAEAMLRQAVEIDPSSAHVRSNLGFLLTLAGRPDDAVPELNAALKLDPESATARGNLLEALAHQVAGPEARADVPVESAMAASVAVPAVALAVPQAVPPKAAMQLELSNGNGIRGAAARLKQWLTGEGLPVDRLSNWRSYDQQQTVIQYRDGQREAALHVARVLRMTAQLAAAPSPRLRTDVRVVLGQDWARTAACLEHNDCERPAMVAETTQRH